MLLIQIFANTSENLITEDNCSCHLETFCIFLSFFPFHFLQIFFTVSVLLIFTQRFLNPALQRQVQWVSRKLLGFTMFQFVYDISLQTVILYCSTQWGLLSSYVHWDNNRQVNTSFYRLSIPIKLSLVKQIQSNIVNLCNVKVAHNSLKRIRVAKQDDITESCPSSIKAFLPDKI